MKNLEKNLLMSAMPFVRDEFIAEASPLAAVPMGQLRRRMLLRWGAVAAGFCLALAVAWLVIPRGDTPDGPPALPGEGYRPFGGYTPQRGNRVS